MTRTRLRAFTLVELMVVIAIIGLLASVLATSVVSKLAQASHDLDKKTLQDLYSHISMVTQDDRARRLLNQKPLAEARGREFWQECFRSGVLKIDMLPKLAMASGHDIPPDRRLLDERETFTLDPTSCSWTGPQGNEAAGVFGAKGKARRVAICANERNWFNFEEEVISIWSDGQVAEYFTLADLNSWGYEITKEQWEMPATELFGTVKPFDGIFD